MYHTPILPSAGPFFCNIHHGKIEHFEQAVVGRKHRFGFRDLAKLTVERLDRVRSIDQPPDLLRKLEIRTEISPILSFAKKRGWTQKLDPKDMELLRSIIADYNEALRRIRVSRAYSPSR